MNPEYSALVAVVLSAVAALLLLNRWLNRKARRGFLSVLEALDPALREQRLAKLTPKVQVGLRLDLERRRHAPQPPPRPFECWQWFAFLGAAQGATVHSILSTVFLLLIIVGGIVGAIAGAVADRHFLHDHQELWVVLGIMVGMLGAICGFVVLRFWVLGFAFRRYLARVPTKSQSDTRTEPFVPDPPPPPAPLRDAIVVHFRYTADEYLNRCRWHDRHLTSTLIRWIGCGLLVLSFAVGVLEMRQSHVARGLFLMGSPFAYLYLFLVQIPSNLRRKYAQSPESDSVQEWQMAAEAIHVHAAGKIFVFAWPNLFQIVQTPAGFLFYPSRASRAHHYLWLPRSSFASEADFTRVSQLARQNAPSFRRLTRL